MSRFLGFAAAAVITLSAIIFTPVQTAFAQQNYNTPQFTDEEKDFISSHSTLKVGFVQDRIPVSFADENGNLQGISKYILDRVSQISGMKFDYVALPTGQVTYDYLTDEGFDLVTSVEYNEENKNARGILISDPYFSSRKVVVAKDDLEFRYDADCSVAVSTGSQTLKKVLARMFPNFELKDFDSISDCFDAVHSGEADLLIQNQYVVEYWLSKPKYEKLKVIPVMGMDDQMCFSAVVSFEGSDTKGPSEEDGKLLISILDKSIASMSEDEVGNYTIQGTMENQYKYTFGDFIDRYRYAVIIFIISAIVIITLVSLLVRQRIKFAESRADAKAKGRFLSTMSHEIRTPLNGLIGLNYLMSQKLDDREKMSEYLCQSSTTAKYLLSLVNDILDSSRLEEQKMELMVRPVDLRLVIETVTSIESTSMEEKRLRYKVEDDLEYPYIAGDEVRIQQVLLNLLDNARKFTPNGGKVTLSVQQELTENGDVLTCIKVADTGKGMSEEFQKHIFNVFSQDLGTVSKGNQGTGLGLFISRRLARLMGGDLTCTSKKDEGSTFTFTFAAKQAEKPVVSEERKMLADGDCRIMVAEDNELNGEIMMELLDSEGYKADLAVNGKQALKLFENSEVGTYGVILMDLLMPEMDGFETAKAIRGLDRPDAKTVRIFACTANSFSEERDKAFESGMDDFITKPINIKELLEKLSS